MNRREFLSVAAGMVASDQISRRIAICPTGEDNRDHRLALHELRRGLSGLGLGSGDCGSPADLRISFAIEPDRYHNPEAHAIIRKDGGIILSAPNDQALLYAVFSFLEMQGVVYGIDGDSFPVSPVQGLVIPEKDNPWNFSPRFAVRGLLPWPDFLNCISVYNEEDFRAYFESMMRMRFNTFGMHVYTGANQWTESYLSFEFAGVGHLAYLDNTASNRWGYLPQRTSRFTMGGADFYASDVFGSEATTLAKDPWETAERSRRLLQVAFKHASSLGIRTGIGFEPYQIPDEIFRALPPEVRREESKTERRAGCRFDIESIAARDLLEARLGQLLDAYPEVDYVWLWEDESMNWDSRKANVPLSVTPFSRAHDFLRRHAPKKRMVLAGWGGVARHFESFHRRLPEDIIFSCLSDSLGWDPLHESFGKLEGRERWPIPWLEDDPSMWLPQFRAHRFEQDITQALKMGCQGMLGIHWRHRIVDPTAIFQARFSWDGKLTLPGHYQAYAQAQASGERAQKLAEILLDADQNRRLLSTFTGEVKDQHAVTREYSGDYTEGFTFWNDYEPDPAIVASQQGIANALRSLTDSAGSATERERLEYLTGHVEFLLPYTAAWISAHRVHKVLREAASLKSGGQSDAAREKVANEGIPLWLELAPEVRKAILHFQKIVATRNDLGTLASMHNKYVRLALVRLRLSIKEYLGELPESVEMTFAQVIRPDNSAPARLFVPTRPSLLRAGEKTRLRIVAIGHNENDPVTLHTRVSGDPEWTNTRAAVLGRKTYEVTLGPFASGPSFAEYYISGGTRVSPPDAPKKTYLVTLV